MTETSAATGTWRETIAGERAPFPWWAWLITGVLGVAFGTAVLVWPDLTLRIMGVITGLWLVVTGLARILGAFLPAAGGLVPRVLSGVVGIVILIAGLICLRDLATRLAVLALMFSVTWILGGVTAVIIGAQHQGPARLVLIAVGVLSLIAGIVLISAPHLSLATLVLLTGVSSLVVGASEVVMAFVLRTVRA
jgi:uncharacterized membrane protein HdeD (DUF308 family)